MARVPVKIAVNMNLNGRNIGKQVRRHRIQQGLSQEELAGRLGARQCYISHIETGKSLPSLGRLLDIADALKISTALLISEQA